MSQNAGQTILSFKERIAKAKQEAEEKAKQLANPSASSEFSASAFDKSEFGSDKTIYFHSSIDAFHFLVCPGKKAFFKDHFFITEDPVEIETVRRDYVSKKSGHVRVTEVTAYAYQAARMIQPEILPLPLQDESLTLTQQEDKLDNS